MAQQQPRQRREACGRAAELSLTVTLHAAWKRLQELQLSCVHSLQVLVDNEMNKQGN